MEGEREKSRDQNEGSGQQQPIGQQNQSQQEFGQSSQPSSGSEPPKSTGTRGEGSRSAPAVAVRFTDWLPSRSGCHSCGCGRRLATRVRLATSYAR